MKVIEFLKFSTSMLKMMSENDVKVDDWQYVEAYEQFLNMRSSGVKYDNAITELANEKHIAKRTLQRAFKRLMKDC